MSSAAEDSPHGEPETFRRMVEALEAVSRISDALVAQPDVDALIELTGGLLEDTFASDFTYVALYDSEASSISFPFFSEGGSRRSRPALPLGDGPTSAVLRRREPLLLHGEADFDLLGERRVGRRTGSYLGVPILSGDNAIGVLGVQSLERAQGFDDADVRLLAAIAANVGAAIRSAGLQREQRESERRYRQLVEAIPIAMYRSPEGEQNSSEYMSPRAVAMFGYPLESWSDPDFYATVLHPDDRDWILAENDLPLTEDESVWVSEYRMITADGRTIWIHDESWTVRDEDGKAQFVQGCMIDVTEQKQAQAELAAALASQREAALEISRQKQYFEALVELSPVAIVVTDRDERVTGWNPTATELFGYQPEEALGRTIGELLAAGAELADEGAAVSHEALSSGRAQRITQRSRKDGSLVNVEMLMAALTIDGEHTGYYVIYHDITELQRARQEAEEATQAKSAFLATMSHEIRTPMNGVIGMTGLLLDTDLDSEQKGFAQVISSSGDALLHIIDDILDYSKIEAGRLELESRPFDLRDCVESALEIVAPRAVGKDIELACLIEDDVPAFVIGDSTRLRQVLLNLLSNAVKFTDQGEIVVRVRSAEPGHAHLSVQDTGIGIPQDRMHRLFESFSQVDASTTRRYGGTGLGLAISQRLVELMGGTIEVESELGVGSTFHLTIRAEAADSAPRPAYARIGQPDLDGKRVLIVDDNATNREILSRQIASWGMHAESLETPAEALVRLRRGEEYDVAVLDMQMPEMDGITLAGEIRRLRESLPLVLATSLAGLQQARTTGEFAAQLTKPIKASQLYEALLEALGAARLVEEAGDADPSAAAAPRAQLRILVAEDNAVNQRLATLLLGKLGYTADLVGNGIEALEALAGARYDVVLMDVQMPELDGLETTRRIVAEYGVDRPRIVAMTANALESDRAECFAAGMDDYVAKPIRPDELAGALARCAPRAARES
jgi:PAS domain S-box-containing protein